MGSRARMMVKLCEQKSTELGNTIEGPLVSETPITSINETLLSEGYEETNNSTNICVGHEKDINSTINIGTDCDVKSPNGKGGVSSSLDKTETPSILVLNNENDSDGQMSFKDFSADDSADEYKIEKAVKRRRSNSTSSISSSSSYSSWSSTSTINNSNNVPNTRQVTPSPEITVAKKGKKRVGNESGWIKNVRKAQKNSGKKYVSRTGKTVAEKSIKPPCMEKCRLKCSTNITEEQRRQIFECYWSLGILERQRDFLSSCITTLKVAYRRVKEGAARNRNQNCKTFFLNTLGISERTLLTVIPAINCATGMIPEDKRGKHANHNQISPQILQSVRDHINSVPRIESHYIRANTSREFIDGGLSIKELHRNYKSNREPLQVANDDTYSRIFNTDFNISFFIPKKDQCDLCESNKNAIGEDKLTLEESYKEHLRQKDLSRKEIAKDIELSRKENSETVVAIYDLQAVMPVAIGNSSAFFYKSKLNCLNFTISDIKNNNTNCYFSHEGLGNRGAIEIGSCVFNFLKETSERHPNCNVIFYSDNCCGQQKNRFLLGMYYYAVETLPVKSITHKYLIRGHTQNEGDNAHSLIEKSMKSAKKSGPSMCLTSMSSLYVTPRKLEILL